jgi:transcriptional regulator with GAF, ATPase, and Fis domain
MAREAASAVKPAMTKLAEEVWERSIARWGPQQATVLVGRHQALSNALERALRFAGSDLPVLISGETGTGKELFTRALYLISSRCRSPFLSVNCAQYQEGHLVASEMFGHRRGSFTGATIDHVGIFEEANGGVVFLDEVGELTPAAQAMLLRTLSEGEIVPVGGTHAKRVDVRVVAATSRDLRAMVDSGGFRADLYFRLRQLHIRVPPVRERGADWELILDYYLRGGNAARGEDKRFSIKAMALLSEYLWPGNVREVRSLVDTGIQLSTGPEIQPTDFVEALEESSRARELHRIPMVEGLVERYEALTTHQGTFWELVHQPFMERELSRAEVRRLVARGLDEARGSYKRLLALFGVAPEDYLRFMDFLRHQRLKPDS